MSTNDLKKKAIGSIEAIEDNGFLENLVSVLENHQLNFKKDKKYMHKVLNDVEEGKEALITHQELEKSLEESIQKHENCLR